MISDTFINEPFPVFENQEQDLIYIIQKLAGLGIKLNPAIKIDDLKKTEFWQDQDLDTIRGKELANLFFNLISYTFEVKSSRNLLHTSADLFSFPADFGSEVRYDEILQNLIRITKIEFDITGITNKFNEQENIASLEFTFNQKTHFFYLKINRHFIDWSFFIQFGTVFNTYLDKDFYILGGDHYIIFYSDDTTSQQVNNFICFKSGIEKLKTN